MAIFTGNLFGVSIKPRGQGDPHAQLRLLMEDDENWHETDVIFSSAWLDDLILQLEAVKARLKSEQFQPDPSGFGYRFRA